MTETVDLQYVNCVIECRKTAVPEGESLHSFLIGGRYNRSAATNSHTLWYLIRDPLIMNSLSISLFV